MVNDKSISSLLTLVVGVAAAVTLIALQPEPRVDAGAGRIAARSSTLGAMAQPLPDGVLPCADPAPMQPSGGAAGAPAATPCDSLPQLSHRCAAGRSPNDAPSHVTRSKS